MIKHDEYTHNMNTYPCAETCNDNIQPPRGPKKVQERFATDLIFFMNNGDCDIDEGSRAHGKCTGVKTNNGILDEMSPSVRVINVFGCNQYEEKDEEGQVDEKNDQADDQHRSCSSSIGKRHEEIAYSSSSCERKYK